MSNRIIYCGNCGKKGHIYKQCYKPIISLGIMCVKYDDFDIPDIIKLNKERGIIFNRYRDDDILTKIDDTVRNNLKFLMVRRKHTLGYIEFVRGNYNLNTLKDMEYIKNILITRLLIIHHHLRLLIIINYVPINHPSLFLLIIHAY